MDSGGKSLLRICGLFIMIGVPTALGVEVLESLGASSLTVSVFRISTLFLAFAASMAGLFKGRGD